MIREDFKVNFTHSHDILSQVPTDIENIDDMFIWNFCRVRIIIILFIHLSIAIRSRRK